jgi:hypothetical protein
MSDNAGSSDGVQTNPLVSIPVDTLRLDDGSRLNASVTGVSAAIRHQVENMGNHLADDLDKLNNLHTQVGRWSLPRHVLRSPLPLTTCESLATTNRPTFMPMFLKYEGSYDRY